jgi:peptide/nickel transport system substrate-binding protein
MLGRKTLAVGAAAAALTLTLAACGGSSSSSSGGGSGAAKGGGTGTLTLGAILLPSSLAAGGAGWANEAPFHQAVYDTLLHATPDAKIVPWLAISWSYNTDKTVLTMKLRTDVKFTDGTPFDASAAAQNIMRFASGTPSASPQKSTLINVKDAKAVDASTLQITLKQPDPALLEYFTQAAGLQESPKAFTASDVKTHPVGSGPYIIDTGKTVIGSKYVYTKNPNYWAKDQQHYANLTINVYQTSATQVNAIRGGQVSGLNLLDNNANAQIKASGYTLFPHELDWTGIILMDRDGTMNKALGNVKVRQAVNYAIDRDAMLKAYGKGYGTVTGQIFPKTQAAYDPALDTMYPYDVNKAKQLLSDAGYGSGVTITMPEINIGTTVQYDLIKQYLGAVGITVNYQQEPLNNAIADILAPKFAASWFILQQDPTAWQLANFSIAPTATWNPFKVSDPTINSLLKTIQTGSEADADAAAKKLNQFVVQQAWFNPWYRIQSNYAANSKTNVVQQSDNAYPYLWNITPKG